MEKDFLEELNHLNSVKSKLKNAKSDLLKRLSNMGGDNLERLKELRENPETGLDFLLFLEQLHEKNLAFNFKDKYKKLDELDYLMRETYFARIDLLDKKSEESKKYYIGKFGYTENEPVITDWRSKVASVFYKYRYPQKNVEYDTPDGKEVKDLEVKRTFEIDNGELIKIYNNDIQFDESKILVDKISGRTGGVLEDIIETIQSSQLDIIESDPRQICIVQGCVGSGKSTVAIHKLSHIFFNFPNYIRPEKSILIAKNQILVSYLSTLFPKLGIFDINYKTLRDLIVNVLYREELKLQYDLNLDESTKDINLNFINLLNEKVDNVHNHVENRIKTLFDMDEFASFGGYKYSRSITPIENVSELLGELEEELSIQKEKLESNPKSLKAWIFKENIKNIRKLLTKIHTIKSEIKEKHLTSILSSLKINVNNTLSYRDITIYLYVYSELIGFSKIQKYEYCIIDEGQDFSLIEYAVLSKFVLRGRFSIFGDLNQSIEDDGIVEWDNIKSVIKEARNAVKFELDTNYRSTKQIIDHANNFLMKYTDKYLPKSINRMGNEPIVETFDTTEKLVESLFVHIDNEFSSLDKSVGIIFFDSLVKAKTIDYLNSNKSYEGRFIILDKTKNITYIPRGVYVMNSEDCKGLEFNKVYIIGLNEQNVNNYTDARKYFVALTRAMNELSILSLK